MDLVDEVLAATARQMSDEASAKVIEADRSHRASFRPHLRAETERTRPEPIFVAAIFGTQRLLTVPVSEEVFAGDEEVRDRLVKAAIIEHFARQEGHVPAFGRITGYVLVVIPVYGARDYGQPYDCDGNPVGPMRTVMRLGEATLGAKPSQNIAPLFSIR